MHQKFSQYNLIRKLVEKYSHSTYLASPIDEPGSQVALTLFPLSLCGSPRENLLLKAEDIKQLQHKHLMPILDMGVEEEQLFVVREYMPSGSLRNRLKSLSPQGLELANALKLLLQVGEALIYAHDLNIFHGNLKPENIFFDANGQARLADFNLISEHNIFIRDHITDRYPLCYIAPEQFVGTCDAKSDQYALGCLAYELITGQRPFAVHSLNLIHKPQSSTGRVRLFETDTHLPLSLEVAVLKSLTQDPKGRFADFSWFIQIIRLISSSLLPPTSPFPDDSERSNESSRLMKLKEAETILSSIKSSTAHRSSVPQIQYVSPIMHSSLGNISKMLISTFIPTVTMDKPAMPTPLMQSTLGKMPDWQNSSFNLQVTMSEQTTPIPFVDSTASAFPLPFSELSGERSRSQVSLQSSKVTQGDAYQLAQEKTEPKFLPKKSPSFQEPINHSFRPHHNSSILFRNAIGLILLFSVILSLIIYTFWLRG